MSVKYVTAGGLRIDYLITTDGRPRLREMGGNAVFSAVGARIWSTDVGILSRVGERYPSEWLDRLRQADISTEGVGRVLGQQEMRTFYAYLDAETRVDTDPEVHFSRWGLPFPDDLIGYVDSTPGQNADGFRELSPRAGDMPESYLSAEAIHFAPLDLSSHLTIPRVLAQKGIRVTLDPGERYMVPERLEEVLSLLHWLGVFLPSRQEVESLMGLGDLWQAAREFAAAGPAVVVIKDGPNGSLVYDRARDRCWTVPVHVAEVVDVTGAGDAYCGGFLVGYAETDDPLMAACYGTVSASFVLEGYGGLFGLRYTREDAELRLGQVWQKAESVLPGHSSAEKLPRGQLG